MKYLLHGLISCALFGALGLLIGWALRGPLVVQLLVSIPIGIATTAAIVSLMPFHGRLPRAEVKRRKRLGLDITPAIERSKGRS